ncbi:MAG: hypothetical protein ACTSU5_19370 [Promethearchaeota archaeon]
MANTIGIGDVWALSLAVASGIVLMHFLGEKFAEREHVANFHEAAGSFGAGLMIGLFFLEILPKISVGETHLDHWIYLIFMLGFVGIHIVEKLVYKQASSSSDREVDHVIFEAVGFAVHGLAIGSAIPLFFEEVGLLEDLFLMVPFFIRGFTIAVSRRTCPPSWGSSLASCSSRTPPPTTCSSR